MMIFNFWNTVVGYFKDKPYWARVEPVLTLLSLYFLALVIAYQFLAWQYHFSPPLPLYLRSYIVKQITLVTVGVGALAFVWTRSRRKRGQPGPQNRRLRRLRVALARSARQILLAGLVLALVIPLFRHFTPHTVSHIRVRFLDEPDFNSPAFVYILYELNRLQKRWYYEVDFDVFNPAELTSEQRRDLEGDEKMRTAQWLARDQPFIGITSRQLGEDYFWRNEGRVSVVSTYGWQNYAPPSVYEFLAHSVIVQSILIHLNAHAGGLPQSAFRESRASYNDLFQFTPRRFAMKAAIPAAHLSPAGEELLFNAFGAEYMSLCSQLVRLEWLRTPAVRENLEKIFRVKL